MRKRLLSILLAAALLISLFPAGIATVAHAAEATEKSEISESTFEALGFNLNRGFSSDDYLSSTKTTMLTKNELYMNINGSSQRGWIFRDNLDLNHPQWTSYETIGAYELYLQYKNGDWADLSAGNGYPMGQTGDKDSVIGTWNSQTAGVSTVAGKTVTFRVEATGTNLTYQWYRSDDGGATWVKTYLAGYSTDILSFAVNASRAALYKCVITDAGGNTAETNTVSVAIG